jgi:hypothetical protein
MLVGILVGYESRVKTDSKTRKNVRKGQHSCSKQENQTVAYGRAVIYGWYPVIRRLRSGT